MAKKNWDRFDEEAEREGNARSKFVVLRVGGYGKRSQKARKAQRDAEKLIGRRTVQGKYERNLL